MLAIAALDRDDRDGALKLTQQSVALQPSWLGYRLAALLSASTDDAVASYNKAWAIGDAPPELAVEIAQYLMVAKRPAELKAFVDALPAVIGDNERIVLARAVVAADSQDYDTVERLLFSRQFATIREGETVLSDLWLRLCRGRLEAKLGRSATAEELRADLAAHPMPRQLDLRMHDVDGA